jgi:hypothetical protein
MSVELVNGHVLIPNAADWTQKPKWSRAWQNVVTGAVTGKESRNALRSNPRVTLSFFITPVGIVATQILDDRIRAAAKSGKACAPYHGRGCIIDETVLAGVSVVTVNNAWPWQAGDYFFSGNENASDAKLVTDADLVDDVWTLTLDDTLDFDHVAGAFAWPLLFGEFIADDLSALTPRIGATAVKITELVSGRTAQVGAVTPDAGDGIGSMVIGDTFVIA